MLVLVWCLVDAEKLKLLSPSGTAWIPTETPVPSPPLDRLSSLQTLAIHGPQGPAFPGVTLVATLSLHTWEMSRAPPCCPGCSLRDHSRWSRW